MRYLLLTAALAMNMQAMVAQSSYQVKNSVTLRNEDCDLTKMSVILPVPGSNIYQDVVGLKESSGMVLDLDASNRYLRDIKTDGTVEDLKDLEGKKVLIRVDFNVPIKDGVIGDDNRMVAALPTIKYITEKGGKAVLFSHLGRVKTEEDKANLSLKPVAEHLADLLNKPVTFVPVTRGAQLEDAIANMNNGDVILVENTRFEDLDGKKESGNDPELGQYWPESAGRALPGIRTRMR